MSPRHSWRARVIAAVATVLASVSSVVAATVVTGSAADAAAAPTFAPGTVVGEAADFATTRWADRWDFNTSSDVLLDYGPASGLISPRFSSGVLGFYVKGHAYISPLWGGYVGSLFTGRDGGLRANQIDLSFWTRFHVHIYAAHPTTAVMQYFTCTMPASSCSGGNTFSLRTGWNDIDLPLVGVGSRIRTGMAQGLRLAFTAYTQTAINIDFLRLYHPNPRSLLTWTSPEPGVGAHLFWSDGSAYPTAVHRNGGPVESVSAATADGSGTTTTDVSGYPPGTRFYAVSSHGVTTPLDEQVRIVALPAPVVDSPSAAGCGSYAAWQFTSTRSLAGYRNLTSLYFNGALTATNGPPQRNDPLVYLPVGRAGIDGRRWHYLTIVYGYVGKFGLANAPGGGMVARVLWGNKYHSLLAQTNDLVTYSGRRTITIDLAQSPTVLTEPAGGAAQRYAFASAAPMTTFRFDPNEDPGARRWTLYSMRLGGTCATRTTFAFTWHDAAYVPGSQATIIARGPDGRDRIIAQVTEHSGTNSLAVYASKLPVGSNVLRVEVTSAAGMARGTGAAPLVISR